MVFPRSVRAVVFDMDGLLLDTESCFRDICIRTAAERGHIMDHDLFHQLVGVPNGDSVLTLRAHYGSEFDAEGLYRSAWARFHDTVDVSGLLKPGVHDLLDLLDALDLPRGVATSAPREAIQTHLAPNGLVERMSTIVVREDYGRGKPAPDPFLTAARRLDVAPEDCLALEDSHNGVRAAHAAGMMTIMVPDLLPATPEMQRLCFRIARDLHEVREILEAQFATTAGAPRPG